MDINKKILTKEVNKIPRTGIAGIDKVHQFVYDLRRNGKPTISIRLRPAHYDFYVYWVSYMAGKDKVYGPDGEVAAPITVDGIQILKGSKEQFAEILPNYAPMEDKKVQKYRDYKEENGQAPEHHSQL